jgi:hypothetical protein
MFVQSNYALYLIKRKKDLIRRLNVGVKDLDWMFECQRNFASNFYNVETMTDDEREQLTVKLSAALHNEMSDLLSGLNFETHRPSKKNISRANILYEAVDVWRYLQAILNVWNVDADDFRSAFDDKDKFLTTRHNLEKRVWAGEPVVLVDVDDVLSDFRKNFTTWIEVEKGVHVDENSKEYYATRELVEAGYTPDELFMEYIEKRNIRNLDPITNTIDAVNKLYDQGFWVHLITARPGQNLMCKYDTFQWIEKVGVKCNRVSFDPEKFLWLSRTEYYKQNKVVCAIDDSQKHATEYAKHGIKCFSPRTSYNEDLINVDGVTYYDNGDDLLEKITCLNNSRIA